MSEAAVPVKRKPGRPVGTHYKTGPQRGKIFTDALHVVLNRVVIDNKTGEHKKQFMIIAEELVQQATDGEPWAIREVLDRIEGRSPVAVTVEEDDKPKVRNVRISFVESKGEE